MSKLREFLDQKIYSSNSSGGDKHNFTVSIPITSHNELLRMAETLSTTKTALASEILDKAIQDASFYLNESIRLIEDGSGFSYDEIQDIRQQIKESQPLNEDGEHDRDPFDFSLVHRT